VLRFDTMLRRGLTSILGQTAVRHYCAEAAAPVAAAAQGPVQSLSSRTLFTFDDKVPNHSNNAYIAPNATLVGEVEVNDYGSVLSGAVIKGDVNAVKIGAYTTIGENSVVSVAKSLPSGFVAKTVIGHYVNVGANSTLHACTVENEVEIGVGSTILEGSIVEEGAKLEAGSVVPPGRCIPRNQVWGGNPVAFVREVSDDERIAVRVNAEQRYGQACIQKDEYLPDSVDFLEVQK